jgi:hypothetical protein
MLPPSIHVVWLTIPHFLCWDPPKENLSEGEELIRAIDLLRNDVQKLMIGPHKTYF